MHVELKDLALLLGGGGIGAVLKWIDDRSKTRAYTLGVVDKAVDTAMRSVTREVERLNTEIDKMRVKHARCETELAEVKQELRSFKERP